MLEGDWEVLLNVIDEVNNWTSLFFSFVGVSCEGRSVRLKLQTHCVPRAPFTIKE